MNVLWWFEMHRKRYKRPIWSLASSRTFCFPNKLEITRPLSFSSWLCYLVYTQGRLLLSYWKLHGILFVVIVDHSCHDIFLGRKVFFWNDLSSIGYRNTSQAVRIWLYYQSLISLDFYINRQTYFISRPSYPVSNFKNLIKVLSTYNTFLTFLYGFEAKSAL